MTNLGTLNLKNLRQKAEAIVNEICGIPDCQDCACELSATADGKTVLALLDRIEELELALAESCSHMDNWRAGTAQDEAAVSRIRRVLRRNDEA